MKRDPIYITIIVFLIVIFVLFTFEDKKLIQAQSEYMDLQKNLLHSCNKDADKYLKMYFNSQRDLFNEILKQNK